MAFAPFKARVMGSSQKIEPSKLPSPFCSFVEQPSVQCSKLSQVEKAHRSIITPFDPCTFAKLIILASQKIKVFTQQGELKEEM